MAPRILLVAATTGYQTRVFADAAQRLGYELRLATDRCHVLTDPWGDQAIPIRFEDPTAAAAQLATLALRPDAIVAVGDRPAVVAAIIAEKLGVPHNSPASVAACRDKYEARERFRAAGLLVPAYHRLPLAADVSRAAHDSEYPCVLKPLGLSGSRGVIRANDPSEFTAAFRRIAALLASPDVVRLREVQDEYIQVESFIPGNEYAVEGILTNGQLQVLAIFDKPDPLNGPFFEETIYVTPSRAPADVQNELVEATQTAARSLGLTRGPLHAELRSNGTGVWPLEVAARPIGGLCARSLRFEGGFGLEELVLMQATGTDVRNIIREARASGVMMIPIPESGIYTGVSGADEARSLRNVDDVVITAKEGQRLLKLPEGNSYLGFIFSRADTPQEVEDSLRSAHRKLTFDIAAELPVMRSISSSI